MDRILKLKHEMIKYFGTDARRIHHFLKVHSFAVLIGQSENLSKQQQYILHAAALVHDIGIVNAEKKYGYNNGKLQEEEGEGEARKMLEELGFDDAVTDRVCFLVAHHHTFSGVDGLDYRILLEADMLVNLHEDNCGEAAVRAALEKVFKTETGKRLCETMFLK